MKNKKQFFSKIERYKAPSTILFRSIELKLLKEKLGPLLNIQPVLDLGCGRGIAALAIFDQKIDYGLDNSPPFLKQAQKIGIYKKTILADAASIPLPDKSVSLVFSNCVVEHLKDLDSTLKEIFRVLTKEGTFIFTVPSVYFKKYCLFNRFGLKKMAKVYGKLRDKKYEHYHSYSLKKWSLFLKKFGLKLADSYYYLDKSTLEFWDLLLILSAFLNLLKFFSQYLQDWIYKAFFRKAIYQYFLKAKTTNNQGAAICLVVQKR